VLHKTAPEQTGIIRNSHNKGTHEKKRGKKKKPKPKKGLPVSPDTSPPFRKVRGNLKGGAQKQGLLSNMTLFKTDLKKRGTGISPLIKLPTKCA